MNKEDYLMILRSDGAARGNPGPAGIGCVIEDSGGRVLSEICEYIGDATNNVAEYTALIKGLQAALKLGVKKAIIYLDSELVVKQINGEYKVKNEGLKPLYFEVKKLLSEIEFKIVHVTRDKNKIADELANKALDNLDSSVVASNDIAGQGRLF